VERNAAGTYTLYDGPSKRILQAGTQPGAADAVLAYIGPRQGKTPVRLYLRGFEPREAKGFVKSTELQLAGFDEPPRLSATVEDSEIEPRQLKALLQEKYNFREARIRSVSEPFVTEEGLTGVHVDAEIPALRAGKPPLLVRIKVILRQGVEMTAQLMAAIRQRIISAFMSGEIRVDEDTLLKTGVFVKTLERISPDVSYVEVKVVKEGKDLHIVRNRDDRARSEAA
jgi:hypothetical protein